MFPILAPAVNAVPVFPRLVGTGEPWYYRLPTDEDLTLGTAGQLSDYAEFLDAEAAATERAARLDEAQDHVPAGVDCGGFALCEAERPRELAYEPEAGVMFVDDLDDLPHAAYL